MADDRKVSTLKCPECGGERRQPVPLDSVLRPTLQIAAAGPTRRDLGRSRIVYQCRDCESLYAVTR